MKAVLSDAVARGRRVGIGLPETRDRKRAMPSGLEPRLAAPSCDTMVALPARSASGHSLLAKNSDRPPSECQPLTQQPRKQHGRGARLRCQYIEIPQSEQTWGFTGSGPAWLWGLEHGVNECGVAIGNEAVATKDQLLDAGLLGMDLVRLGLERAATAREGVDLIGGLIERFGQGGSSARDFDWRYSNGFLIADATEAWILETSTRQWAARRVRDCVSISNAIGIAACEAASPEVREHARAQGWWDGKAPFDFAAAYADREHRTTLSARARLLRSGEMVSRDGRRTVREMFAILRDHYEMGEMPIIKAPPDSERHYSLCMHTDFVATTASMVAEIPAPDTGRSPVMWASMAAPCTGIFFPLYPAGTIPRALKIGSTEASTASIWWRMKAIQDRVAQAPERLAPIVWRHFRPLEDRILERAEKVGLEERGLPAAERSQILTGFMLDNVALVLDAVGRVEAEVRSSSAE